MHAPRLHHSCGCVPDQQGTLAMIMKSYEGRVDMMLKWNWDYMKCLVKGSTTVQGLGALR